METEWGPPDNSTTCVAVWPPVPITTAPRRSNVIARGVIMPASVTVPPPTGFERGRLRLPQRHLEKIESQSFAGRRVGAAAPTRQHLDEGQLGCHLSQPR